MAKAKETVLEINLNTLEHNYNYLRSKLMPNTMFMAVVKAFAYGSDAAKVAMKLQSLGADYFAVAYVNEGVALRKAGITKPILVLHPLSVNFNTLLKYCLEPSIYSLNLLNQFVIFAKKKGTQDYPVHLKFNTGLNRLGFKMEDTDTIIEKIKGNNHVKVASIFSHLAASEDTNEVKFTESQIATYEKISAKLIEKLGYYPLRHLLNTSGILNYITSQYDMVRSGIGLYGFGNDPTYDKELKPIATLKTIISQIHNLEPNESLGYNRAFISDTYRTTATLPLGHADGIGRQYGNGNTVVLVNGQKATIVGNVCMDMIMIDVTGIACKEGDEVIIFGPELSASEFAGTANTISYELLTGVSQRVKRLIV
ncbi:alanine racemase [Maribacter sp. CXY002]|uniref:alanine racemase n=1 Tax=Maribacter luteocoastalis TaxID=3407671 RepID=UPI003B67A95D